MATRSRRSPAAASPRRAGRWCTAKSPRPRARRRASWRDRSCAPAGGRVGGGSGCSGGRGWAERRRGS
ncbi:MAG: hypothetical protein FJX74_05760 [Armatimonadetes bacterium]|nr:hypothetical protein [Armatimonadota bacterium]